MLAAVYVGRYDCLPQGLASAPRVFTKIMKPPFVYLRQFRFTLLGYIDETLVLGDEPLEVSEAIDVAVQALSLTHVTCPLC